MSAEFRSQDPERVLAALEWERPLASMAGHIYYLQENCGEEDLAVLYQYQPVEVTKILEDLFDSAAIIRDKVGADIFTEVVGAHVVSKIAEYTNNITKRSREFDSTPIYEAAAEAALAAESESPHLSGTLDETPFSVVHTRFRDHCLIQRKDGKRWAREKDIGYLGGQLIDTLRILFEELEDERGDSAVITLFTNVGDRSAISSHLDDAADIAQKLQNIKDLSK